MGIITLVVSGFYHRCGSEQFLQQDLQNNSKFWNLFIWTDGVIFWWNILCLLRFLICWHLLYFPWMVQIWVAVLQQFPAVHFWNSLDCCFLLSLKVSVCKAGKVVHLLWRFTFSGTVYHHFSDQQYIASGALALFQMRSLPPFPPLIIGWVVAVPCAQPWIILTGNTPGGVQSMEFNGTFNTMDDNNHLQELTTPTFSCVSGEVLCARRFNLCSLNFWAFLIEDCA